MRGLGTDHVISGPMRGLKKTAFDGTDRQTDRQKDIATLRLDRPSGPIQWKSNNSSNVFTTEKAVELWKGLYSINSILSNFERFFL